MFADFQTILLTRPIEAATRFASELPPEARERVIISPLVRIEKLDVLAEFEAVILTSENGLPEGTQGTGRPAYCVGKRTAIYAKQAGLEPILVEQCADDLVSSLISNPSRHRLTHFRGEFARGQITERLTAAGIDCAEIITYRQVSQPFSQEALVCLGRDVNIILPLFSPRSAILAEQQIESLDESIRLTAKIKTVALSSAVASNLKGVLAKNVEIAPKPTGEAMHQIVASYLNK